VAADRRASPENLSCDILVVDDNRHHLDIIAALLEAGGHRVTACQSSAEALRILAERAFDLVVLDMVMPDINGFAVLRAMRAGGPNAQTPVFACTANYLLARRELEGCFGVVEIIAKPIDAAQLLRAAAVIVPAGRDAA
jgi:CheY-like chemotaxis protein